MIGREELTVDRALLPNSTRKNTHREFEALLCRILRAMHLQIRQRVFRPIGGNS